VAGGWRLFVVARRSRNFAPDSSLEPHMFHSHEGHPPAWRVAVVCSWSREGHANPRRSPDWSHTGITPTKATRRSW
jgi:hypothetical protein